MTQARPGPKSLQEKTGEETTMIKIMVTLPQKDYLSGQDVSTAEYIRSLVDVDMALNRIDVDPKNLDTEILEGLGLMMRSLKKKMAT